MAGGACRSIVYPVAVPVDLCLPPAIPSRLAANVAGTVPVLYLY